MNWLSKRLSWVLLLASASLFYLPLGARALWNSDEGRYAEIAREMLELKDWVSPHLNYVLYFEKPPLVYWLTAASLTVFGHNEFAARFWSATFGLLTIGVVYLIGKHWKGERAGLLAGSILATSFLFFALTQFLVLDMALTFWTTLALYASSRILVERPPELVRKYTVLFALAMAGGFLTKGLIGVIFPVAVLVLVIAYGRLWGQARKIPWQSALVITIIVSAPWVVLVSLKHPMFPYYFFVREHLVRFLTSLHHRDAPFYFFVPVILAGFMPWTVFLPKVFVSSFENRGLAMKRDPVRALLVLWTLFVFFFFSISQSKLVAYMLPVIPALALLVGVAFEEVLEEPDLPRWVECGVIGLVLLNIAAICALKFPWPASVFQDSAILALRSQGDTLSLIVGLNVFVLVGVWGMRQSLASLGGIIMAQVLLLSTLASLVTVLDPWLSNKGLARILSQRAASEERIVSYGISYENVLQALPFYLKRRIAVYGDAGELAMGADETPDAADWFSPESEARNAVARLPAGSWVITNEEYHKDLAQAGIARAFEPAGREGRLLLFHKIR